MISRAEREALAVADEVQRLEKLRTLDRATFASMSPDERLSFSRYYRAASEKRDEKGQPVPAMGPSSWRSLQRLQASEEPWHEASRLVAQADAGQGAAEGWLLGLAKQAGALEKEAQRLGADYAQREKSAALAKEAATIRARLAKLNGLDPVSLYYEFSADASRRAEEAQARVSESFDPKEKK